MATCIIGEPGTGKTRLAATWPESLWLNGEGDGNATALPGLERPQTIDIPPTNNAVNELIKHMTALVNLEPDKEGYISYQNMKAKSVILDSFDVFQDVAKYQILGRRNTMEMRDWGVLETVMRPILMMTMAMKVPMVVVAHVNTIDRGEGLQGRKTWSLQGGIKARMDRTFSEILHLVIAKDGSRVVATQPYVLDGYMLLAKDRHQRLKSLANNNGFVPVVAHDGYPDTQIADAILGRKHSE